jgi:type VI secretion system protein ImpC
VRDKIGSFKERADMETWLNNWIIKYVENNPSVATDADKARKPLAGAEVTVSEIEGNPGYYAAKFSLRPHYQLEGLSVEMSLVSKLPSGKA